MLLRVLKRSWQNDVTATLRSVGGDDSDPVQSRQDKSGLVSYQELDMQGAEVLAEFKPLGRISSCCIGCVMGCISWNAERWWRSSGFRYHVQPMVWVLAFVSSLSIWPVSRADMSRCTSTNYSCWNCFTGCPKQAAFVPLTPPIHPCLFFIYFPNRNH